MAYFDYTVREVIKAMESFNLRGFIPNKFAGRLEANREIFKKFDKKYPDMWDTISQFCKIATMVVNKKPIRKAVTCPICKSRRYIPHTVCKDKQCLVEQRKRTLFKKNGSLNCTSPEVRKRQRQTCMKRYGVPYPLALKAVRDKYKATMLRKYGVDNPLKSEAIKAKVAQTNMEKYGAKCVLSKGTIIQKEIIKKHKEKHGVETPFQRDTIQKVIQKVKSVPEDWTKVKLTKDSKPKDFAHAYLARVFPDTIRGYRSEEYPYTCDFYIPSKDLYIECHFHWTHGSKPYTGTRKQVARARALANGSRYKQTAYEVWTKRDVTKRETARNNRLNWREFFNLDSLVYWLDEDYATKVKVIVPGKKQKVIITSVASGVGCNVSERFRRLYEVCLNTPFPGSSRWPWNHPIWKCKVDGKMSPWQAWQKPDMVEKAVLSLEKKWTNCERFKERRRLIAKWERNVQKSELKAAQVVLSRFTQAKIAPLVNFISEAAVKAILTKAKKDLTKGVYCPMAGFGTVVKVAKSFGVEVEAYDINKRLNAWYGWEHRNVLTETIITKKLVIACPPVYPNTEVWPGTPKDMYLPFEEWCALIRRHVIAPRYVFIGTKRQGKKQVWFAQYK